MGLEKLYKKVEYKNNLLHIKFKADKDEFYNILNQIKMLYGIKFNINTKTWTVPPTKKNIGDLANMKFDFDESVFRLFKNNNSDYTKIELKKKMPEGIYPFQIDGIKFLENRKGNGLIADAMGLGKTIQAISYFIENPEIRPVLIVCPASVKLNWKREIIKWTDYKDEDIQILKSKKTYSLLYSCWYIINYDILDSWKDVLIGNKIAAIVSDESQFICNSKSKRTKAFKKLAKKIDKRIFLSGTPIKNSPREFFTVLNLLDNKCFPKEYSYLYRFCNPKYNGFGWIFKGVTNWEELHKSIKPLMIRREKSDVLKDLPKKRKIIVPIECTQIEFEKYQQAIVEIENWINENEKKNMIEIKKRLEFISTLSYGAKRKQVINWIRDYINTGEKLVLFAYHLEVLNDLQSAFSDIKTVRIDGSVKSEDRQKIIDQFQNDLEIKLFIGQIKAAGIGITLTAASAVAFVEFSWTPADHEQAEDRIHRIGQKADSVTAYYLVAEGTIEKDIVEMIQKKYDTVKKVIDGKSDQEFFDKNILKKLF